MTPFLDRKLADVQDLAVVGFVEVLRHLPRLRRLFQADPGRGRGGGHRRALLIDYPGFNLRLAKALRRTMPQVRLHQYVCPQVWAWKAGRIPELGRTLDTLYCLFDFEPRLFQGYPVEALWVGNPLVETVVPEVDREAFFRRPGWTRAGPWWPCCPGSRSGGTGPAHAAPGASWWRTGRPARTPGGAVGGAGGPDPARGGPEPPRAPARCAWCRTWAMPPGPTRTPPWSARAPPPWRPRCWARPSPSSTS